MLKEQKSNSKQEGKIERELKIIQIKRQNILKRSSRGADTT